MDVEDEDEDDNDDECDYRFYLCLTKKNIYIERNHINDTNILLKIAN